DDGATWTSRASRTMMNSTGSHVPILLPGNNADTQDIFRIDKWSSVAEFGVYDDSANTWSFTTIESGLTQPAGHTNFGAMGAAVRHSDGHVILVLHTRGD